MLEKRIEELTAAVVALIEVMKFIRVPNVKEFGAVGDGKTDDTAAIQKAVNSALKVEDLPNEPKKSEDTPPTSQTSSPESAPAVSYDDVKNIVIAVSKVNKAKAVAALSRFGVKTAKELEPLQWPEFVAYLKKVQDGEIDPEASN